MKNFLLLFTLVFFPSFLPAQGVTLATKDKTGNYVQAESKPSKPKTAADLTKNATATGKTITLKAPKDATTAKGSKAAKPAKGEVLPVYQSKSGRLFYLKTSKSGNQYRSYITEQ